MTAANAHSGKKRWGWGGRHASVRALLLWLMLACLLPGMLGATAILYRSYLNERAQLAQDTNQTTRALMQAADAEFARIQSLTQALAMSEHLAQKDLAAFHAQALDWVKLTPFDHNFLLCDSSGQQLMNTLRPYPSPLPARKNLELVLQVFETGLPVIGGLNFGAVRKEPVMTVDVPVWNDGRVVNVLNFTTVPAAFLREILRKQALPADWVVAFFDAQGTIAFRSHGGDRFIGQKGPPALVTRIVEVAEGTLETHTVDGIPVTAVFSRSLTSNWSVAIKIPTQSFTARLHRSFLWLAIAMTSLLGVGALLALGLGKRISQSVYALQEPARALGKGGTVTMPPLYLKEAQDVGTALLTASQVLQRAEQQRQESDAQLTATAHRLAAHMRNSPLAIVEFDRDFHIQRWSPEAERLFGWQEKAMLGLSHFDSQLVHQDDIAKAYQCLAELHSGASSANVCSIRNYRQDGTVINCEWYNSALHDENGNLTSVLSQVLDVTERTRAQKAMQSAMMQAESANNAKSRFLAAASHDLRQPLTALSLYVELLKSKVASKDKALVAQIRECIVSLGELLSDLLDLSKLEAGVVTPNVSDFSLAEMLASLTALHSLEAAVKGLQLRSRATRLTGHTDPVLFQRIVGNLIHNAIRYTDRGGVLVACRSRQGKTWVEVYDTGIGIPANQTAEIFEEFRQLGDQARNKGSGLGLAIVAKTAALLGLEIRVRSRPGRGSAFAIELPLGQSAAPRPESRPADIRPLSIALVEDNPLVRHALTESLQMLGHRVVAAASLGALLLSLDPVPPDVVISDFRLTGGETGFDVITALRTRFGADLPAVLITGDTAPALLRSMADHHIHVLHKPIELAALQACLEVLTAG